MKTYLAAIPLVALLISPLAVRAHERQIFEINGINYQFVVGSVSEPVYIDDKSGVEIRIERLNIMPGHEEHHGGVGPGAVEGLEKTLKVELISEDKRKPLDLAPAYGEVGLYRAPFFPTASAELSYRFFGTLEDIPIDVTFTCSSAGHQMEGTTDKTRQEISPGVVRVSKAGTFSCPRDKSDMGFPYETSDVMSMKKGASFSKAASFGAVIIALAVLGVALRHRSS